MMLADTNMILADANLGYPMQSVVDGHLRIEPMAANRSQWLLNVTDLSDGGQCFTDGDQC